MKDTVLKGTGNSRFLKSVEDFKTRYPTYDDFVAALVAGTLPIDLNGINAAGMDQVGTALNKASLLTDTVAALVAAAAGGTSPDTPNQALGKIAKSLSYDRVRVGGYSGNGTYGMANPTRLTFDDFTPYIILISEGADTLSLPRYGIISRRTNDLATFHIIGDPSGGEIDLDTFDTECFIGRNHVGISDGEENQRVVSWYSTKSATWQFNMHHSYYYAAFGRVKG